MSLWVEPPEVVDTTTGRRLLNFKDPNWSLESATWQSDSVANLKLRKHPGNQVPHCFDAWVDCDKNCGTASALAVSDLAQFEAALEKLYVSGRR